MLSGHKFSSSRGSYVSIDRMSTQIALKEEYDKHMNNNKGGYFPIESMEIKKNEMDKLLKKDPDFHGQIQRAILILDSLVKSLKKR